MWRKPEGERHRALRQGDGQERIAARILAHYPQALGHAENGFSGRCGRGLRPRRPPSGAKEKGPRSWPDRGPLGPLGGNGNALGERDVLSSHGLTPQYFRRWQA